MLSIARLYDDDPTEIYAIMCYVGHSGHETENYGHGACRDRNQEWLW
jgi:hypothetical protein